MSIFHSILFWLCLVLLHLIYLSLRLISSRGSIHPTHSHRPLLLTQLLRLDAQLIRPLLPRQQLLGQRQTHRGCQTPIREFLKTLIHKHLQITQFRLLQLHFILHRHLRLDLFRCLFQLLIQLNPQLTDINHTLIHLTLFLRVKEAK